VSVLSQVCPVCSIDKTLLTKMKVAMTFDQIIIKELEAKVTALEEEVEDLKLEIAVDIN
jgi:hypothetical protein